MNTPAPTRPTSLQTYQTIVYRRALHPELFTLKGRRTVRHGGYELEAWLMPGAHLLRFQHKGFCACELVTPQEDGLPTEGLITAFLCAGEHDFEQRFESERVVYMTSVMTETLSENLYNATYAEMLATAEDGGGEAGAMVHRWQDPEVGGATGGRCLSRIDMQRFSREVHVQAFHLIAQGGFVLRTQTIFEHK